MLLGTAPPHPPFMECLEEEDKGAGPQPPRCFRLALLVLERRLLDLEDLGLFLREKDLIV